MLVGDRLTVGQRTLTPPVLVRIQVPQPRSFTDQRSELAKLVSPQERPSHAFYPAAMADWRSTLPYGIMTIRKKTREDIMPRIVLALVLCCAAVHGAAAAAGRHRQGRERRTGQLPRPLDHAARRRRRRRQRADGGTKRLRAPQAILIRPPYHRENRRGGGQHRRRTSAAPNLETVTLGALHRPGSKPIGSGPTAARATRPMDDPPLGRAATGARSIRCGGSAWSLMMAFARDHNRTRLSGVLLEPFWSRPAHIVQLGPIAI